MNKSRKAFTDWEFVGLKLKVEADENNGNKWANKLEGERVWRYAQVAQRKIQVVVKVEVEAEYEYEMKRIE